MVYNDHLTRYNTSLSLGFGRPHPGPVLASNPQGYFNITQGFENSASVDLPAAAYMASLGELSAVRNHMPHVA